MEHFTCFFFFANEQVAAPIAFVTSASALFLALFECASRFDNMILLASIFHALFFSLRSNF